MSDKLRIDKWLWFARFCKTRGIGQGWLEDGLVSLNGQTVTKPASQLKPGDELILPMGRMRRQVRVLALGERRGPAPEAQALYQELAVLPPAEE